MIAKIKKQLRLHKRAVLKLLKEHLAILACLVAFFISPRILRFFDPTAAAYDAGVLQIAIVTLTLFTLFQWAVWQTVKTIWPSLGEYFKTRFESDFNALTEWQKIKISLLVYFCLFAALVMLSRVIQ